MSDAANTDLVRRYFSDVLDGGNNAAMAELFAIGAVQHFPGRTLTYTGGSPRADLFEREFRTTLHHLVAQDDMVAAHLTHEVNYGSPAVYRTRIGTVDVSGRNVRWEAMAMFRIESGKIAEEWVSRDELDVLAQLGAIQVQTIA